MPTTRFELDVRSYDGGFRSVLHFDQDGVVTPPEGATVEVGWCSEAVQCVFINPGQEPLVVVRLKTNHRMDADEAVKFVADAVAAGWSVFS